jgi:hypothetical protein
VIAGVGLGSEQRSGLVEGLLDRHVPGCRASLISASVGDLPPSGILADLGPTGVVGLSQEFGSGLGEAASSLEVAHLCPGSGQ